MIERFLQAAAGRRRLMFACCIGVLLSAGSLTAGPWRLHTVDDSSRGADGVRLADVNGDELPDVVTGWEEGGRIRACLNPGPEKAASKWPSVTVGRVKSPEDAVFVDLDGDGATDVVSSCEGGTRTVFAHWAPKEADRWLDEKAWTTEAFPATRRKQAWMYCLPLQLDGAGGVDLVVASKGGKASVSWLRSPEDPRSPGAWELFPIVKAGWVMSLVATDVNGDGRTDVLFSDRKGSRRGVWWAEHPGEGVTQPWPVHLVGGRKSEVMFLSEGDVDGDGREDVVCAVRGGGFLVFRRKDSDEPAWETSTIAMPEQTGTGKGVRVGDIDLDGRPDVFFTCENAGKKHGAMWLSRRAEQPWDDPEWTAHEVSGTERGVKFDRVELLDLDGDGDLDALTCEERDNLGVVWYENPVR